MQQFSPSQFDHMEAISLSDHCLPESFEENLQRFNNLFDLLSDEEIEQEYSKLQKSNYVKNLLRSFYLFVYENGDEVVIESMFQNQDKDISQIRKEFQTFIRQKKFNQTTLCSLVNSKRFGKIFHYFLYYYVYDWIESRSVKDLKSHVLYITHLKRQIRINGTFNGIKLTYNNNND